jgi:hypothetical protein
VEKPLKPICQNYGNYLISNIAENDRFEMIDRERVQLFWNQSNKSVILFIIYIYIYKIRL